MSLEKLDVRAWQYCLWYRIIEAALAGSHNPKIDDLPGFDRPAATRYRVSTPALLSWCKGYNRGRSYRAQIKPFGFMLRFYAGEIADGQVMEESLKRKHVKPPKPPKPIAPYDVDTARASKNCFDRTTGQPVGRDRLSSYCSELRQYHIHPDSKFIGAEHFDRGLTRRRHVQVREVIYIGKEADKLEEQLELGSDPEAVIHYERALEHRIQKLRADLADTNLSRLRTASGVSRQSLAAVRDGRTPTKMLAGRIIAGLRRLEAADKARAMETDGSLSLAWTMRARIGLRPLASKLNMDHSTLSQILSGVRKPSEEFRRRLEALARSQRILPPKGRRSRWQSARLHQEPDH